MYKEKIIPPNNSASFFRRLSSSTLRPVRESGKFKWILLSAESMCMGEKTEDCSSCCEY